MNMKPLNEYTNYELIDELGNRLLSYSEQIDNYKVELLKSMFPHRYMTEDKLREDIDNLLTMNKL